MANNIPMVGSPAGIDAAYKEYQRVISGSKARQAEADANAAIFAQPGGIRNTSPGNYPAGVSTPEAKEAFDSKVTSFVTEQSTPSTATYKDFVDSVGWENPYGLDMIPPAYGGTRQQETAPIDYNKSIAGVLASPALRGPSERDLAVAGAKDYDKRVGQANATLRKDTAKAISKYGSKIKSGLTPAEKKELELQLKANEQKYKAALKDAEGAYNFATTNIAKIGQQSAALNAALLPAAAQYGQEAASGLARIAAESGLSGVGGGVTSAPVSDAARAAAVDARNAIAGIVGTEAAGVEISPAIAGLLASAPAMEFAGQTINPRQFGALQSGRLGTDIASTAIAAGQASSLSGIARSAAEAEASMRNNAMTTAMRRYEAERAEMNKMSMQAELSAASQVSANSLSVARSYSDAYAKDPRTPRQVAEQQLKINEAAILMQAKYSPTPENIPTIGDAYQSGLDNPVAQKLVSITGPKADASGNIVISTPGTDKEPLLYPASLVDDFIITTVGMASTLPDKERKAYITKEVLSLGKDSREAAVALAIALTGSSKTSTSDIVTIINTGNRPKK